MPDINIDKLAIPGFDRFTMPPVRSWPVIDEASDFTPERLAAVMPANPRHARLNEERAITEAFAELLPEQTTVPDNTHPLTPAALRTAANLAQAYVETGLMFTQHDIDAALAAGSDQPANALQAGVDLATQPDSTAIIMRQTPDYGESPLLRFWQDAIAMNSAAPRDSVVLATTTSPPPGPVNPYTSLGVPASLLTRTDQNRSAAQTGRPRPSSVDFAVTYTDEEPEHMFRVEPMNDNTTTPRISFESMNRIRLEMRLAGLERHTSPIPVCCSCGSRQYIIEQHATYRSRASDARIYCAECFSVIDRALVGISAPALFSLSSLRVAQPASSLPQKTIDACRRMPPENWMAGVNGPFREAQQLAVCSCGSCQYVIQPHVVSEAFNRTLMSRTVFNAYRANGGTAAAHLPDHGPVDITHIVCCGCSCLLEPAYIHAALVECYRNYHRAEANNADRYDYLDVGDIFQLGDEYGVGQEPFVIDDALGYRSSRTGNASGSIVAWRQMGYAPRRLKAGYRPTSLVRPVGRRMIGRLT